MDKMPVEILQKIFTMLFEGVSIPLNRPHDLNPQELIHLFPILSVDTRFLTEGIDILLRVASVEIADLTSFPIDGPALVLLREVRQISLQKCQLVTFQLSRKFPYHASRSSRNSFESLQRIDISIDTSLSDKDSATMPGQEVVPTMIYYAWSRYENMEKFELYQDYHANEIVEFIKSFQKKFAIVLKLEFWVGDRLVSTIPATYICSLKIAN